MLKLRTILALTMSAAWLCVPASAQNAPVSPVLLLESGPSDNPNYRRMVFTKYLQRDSVTVNYKAYNRAEFIQVGPQTPAEIIQACSRGPATTLRQLNAFEREEAKRARAGQPPEIARFCIKNVRNWNESSRARYVDPIFNGMPPSPVN